MDTKKCIKISAIIIISVLLITVLSIPTTTGQQNSEKTKTRTIDLGKSGSVGTSFQESASSISLGGNVDLSGGVELPVEVVSKGTNNLNPGDNLPVEVDVNGKKGSVWFSFNGAVNCNVGWSVISYDFQKDYTIPKTNLLNFDVALEDNYTQTAVSDELTMAEWSKEWSSITGKEYYLDVNVRAVVELEMISSSFVTGNISLDSDAIDSAIDKNYKWISGKTFSESAKILQSATSEDQINMDVEDIIYHLEDLNLDIKGLTIYAGYESNHDIIGSKPYAIERQISFEDFAPSSKLKSDVSREKGELIKTSENVKGEDISMSFNIEEPQEKESGSDTDDGSSDEGSSGGGGLPGFTIPVLTISTLMILVYKKFKNFK